MLDDRDADSLSDAYWHVKKALTLIESIVTDDDKLNDPYDRLETASFEMGELLDAYEEDRTKDWDTPLGDY